MSEMTILTDPNADTDKVYADQKKYIWPAAFVIALMLGSIAGGQFAKSRCADALDAAERAQFATSQYLIRSGPNDEDAARYWADISSTALDDYKSAASNCR